MRRWALRTLIALTLIIALLIVAAIGIQLFLISDYPRRIVMSRLEQETGLQFACDDVSPTWFGGTSIDNLRIALALEDQDNPFVIVPHVEAEHTSVLEIIVARAVDLNEINIHEPRILATRDSDGAWNVLAALGTIMSVQAAKEPAAPGGPGIPTIRVRDATISFTSGPGAGQFDLAPVSFEGGAPAGSTAWEFNLELPQCGVVTGEFAQNPGLAHRISFALDNLAPIVAHVAPEAPIIEPLSIEGNWRGEFPKGGDLAASLHVDKLRIGETSVTGDLRITRRDSQSVEPARVAVEFDQVALTDTRIGASEVIRVNDGSIASTDRLDQFDINQLRFVTFGTTVNLGGAWDLERQSGELTAAWVGAIAGAGVDHAGEAEASISLGGLHARVADLLVRSAGSSAAGTWTSEIAVAARADSEWNTFTVDLATPCFVWSEPEEAADEAGLVAQLAPVASAPDFECGPAVELNDIDLSGLSATSTIHWPMIEVTQFDLPHAAESRLLAQLNAAERTWAIEFNVSEWAPPRVQFGPIDLMANASGRERRIESLEAQLNSDPVSASVRGSFDDSRPKPFQAQADVSFRAPFLSPSQAESPRSATDSDESTMEAAGSETPDLEAEAELAANDSIHPTDDPQLVSETSERGEVDGAGLTVGGEFRLQAAAAGHLDPMRLELSGAIDGDDILLGERPLASVLHIPFHGNYDSSGLDIESEVFELLEGEWRLAAALDRNAEPEAIASLHLVGRDTPLQRIIDALGAPVETGGELDTELVATLPGWNRDRLRVEGEWAFDELHRAERIVAGRGRGRFAAEGDAIVLRDIQLEHAGGVVTGAASFNTRDNRRLAVDLRSDDWPIQIQGVESMMIRLSGAADAIIDLAEVSAAGNIDISTEVLHERALVGRFDLRGAVLGRTLQIVDLNGELAGGAINGRGTIPLDEWTQTEAEFDVTGIELARMKQYWPALGDSLGGDASGRIGVKPRPTADLRSREPLRVNLEIEIEDGHYGEMALDGIDVLLYAGDRRFIIDDATLRLAGGSLELWQRLTWHGEEAFTHMHVVVDDLDLNQLVHAADADADADAEPMPGIISGRGAFGGYVRHPRRAFGQGVFHIRNSDLANFGPIATIYDALNPGGDDDAPSGSGTVHVRLEGDTLEITRFEYFNRGADVLASLTVENLWLGAASPIVGVAAGTMRPFRDVELPIVADLDEILTALQADAVTVRIAGTIDNRMIEVVPLEQVGGTISTMLKAVVAENQ